MQDSHYDKQQLRRKLQKNDLGSRYVPLSCSVGIDVQRRSTLRYIASDTVATIKGANLAFVNLSTNATQYLLPLDGQGIACFTMHPQGTLLAVGERGMHPNIYIYSYPALQIVKVLKGGTTFTYSDLAFNASGDKLASVGNKPDFMLTVWDWEQERILLHSKAFGQEVFKVAFSQDDENRLTTCGTGHIRFWKMANTFTGLKLQGAIGKFGKVELTDIASFVELPDGKVVSTSEAGALLLWEGSFIKCRFVRPGTSTCHDGAVRMLLHARDENAIISAGDDGVIRWWDFPTIDTAEVDSDNTMDFELTPTRELVVGNDAKIHWLERSQPSADTADHFLCADLNGYLWQVPLAEGEIPTILSRTHSGAIRSVDACPGDATAATCGEDGTVVLWDLLAGSAMLRAKFSQPATTARWMSPNNNFQVAILVVGFEDGVVRLLQRSESTWVLLQAEKPHNEAIVAVQSISQLNGFCTSSTDGTLFFFEFSTIPQTRPCFPLGFVNLQGQSLSGHKRVVASALEMRADGSYLLCACTDATIRELDVSTLKGSADENAEGADSLELRPTIAVTSFLAEELRSLHEELRTTHQGEEAPEEPQPGTDSDQGAAAAATTTTEPTAPPGESQKAESFSISSCSYVYRTGTSDPHALLFSATGLYSGSLFEVRLRDMQLVRAYIAADPPSAESDMSTLLPTVVVRRMPQAGLIVTGSQDGTVTIRPMDALHCFARITAHDLQRGGCVDACISADGKYLLTVGHDSILNIYALDLQNFNSSVRSFIAMPTSEIEASSQFVITQSGHGQLGNITANESVALTPIAEDILEAESYSIREVKARKEADSRQHAANQHKAYFRTLIEAIRKDFRAILAENARQPAHVQLDRSQLNVDLDYHDILLEHRLAAIEEVHKVNAYASEFAWKLRTKLQQHYWDPVLVPTMQLRGFHNHEVRSLRTRQLEPSVSQIVSMVQMTVKRDEMARQRAGSSHQHDQSTAGEDGTGLGERDAEIMHGADDGGMGATYAARKALRSKRKAEIAAHLAAKPDESQDDPRDLAAIETAIATLGDYSLKSSEDYEVPESQRVNAEKKRRQMAMLEESLVSMRLGFNERFLALRQLKYHINAMIKAANARIHEIDQELGQPERSEQLWEPSIAPEEYVADITDITLDEVETYREERKNKTWDTAKAPPQTKFSTSNIKVQLDENTGGYNLIKEVPTQTVDILKIGEEVQADDEPLSSRSSPRDGMNVQQEHLKFSVVENVLRKDIACAEALIETIPTLRFAQQCIGKLPADQHSEWAAQRLVAHQEKLRFERASLLNYIEENVGTFDDAVYELRRDRLQVMSDLKVAELRLLVCFEEYLQLLQFESRDVALQQRQVRARTEKAEIRGNITDLQARLQAKQVEMTAWEEKAAGLLGDCVHLVPTTHPFHEHLLKIFKRKIKRKKHKLDDDTFDEDSSDYDDDDLSDEEDDLDDSCPPGCDTGLYEQVIELREKRLDMEDVLQDVQTISNDIKRNLDRLVVRERQIDKEIAQTEVEVTQFQKEKQQALNKIELAVPLRMSQIFCFPPEDEGDDTSHVLDTLPMKSYVLIPNSTLNDLQRRISELGDETNEARQQYRSLHKHQTTLAKQLQVYKERIEHWTEKCQELQLLKFGQLVDLDHIDVLSDRTNEEAAEATVRELEQEHNLRVAQLAAKENQLKKLVHQQVVKNTELLKVLADGTEQQMELESTLNTSTVISGVDQAKEQRAVAVERAKLMAHARAQAREIESLKMEITMLRRKEAVLYAAPNPLPPPGSRQSRPVHVPSPTLPQLVSLDDRSGEKLAVTNSIASAGSSARRIHTS